MKSNQVDGAHITFMGLSTPLIRSIASRYIEANRDQITCRHDCLFLVVTLNICADYDYRTCRDNRTHPRANRRRFFSKVILGPRLSHVIKLSQPPRARIDSRAFTPP